MKHFIFILIYISAGISTLYAQDSNRLWANQVLHNDILFNNTDSMLAAKDSAVKILYGNNQEEGSQYSRFKKSLDFIETRLPSHVNAMNIMETYTKALGKARIATQGSNACSFTGYRGDWKNIGPKSKPNYQNQGVIVDVWANANASKIIIGAENGGLWRTINGGVDWVNITDNSIQMGTMGIRSFSVNPNDPNNDDIWVTTMVNGAGFFNAEYMYGTGIYHTTDGGLTWAQEQIMPNTIPNFINFKPSNFYASKVKFCPYLVNSQSYVVLAVDDHILTKLGNAPWVDMTPTGLTYIFPNNYTRCNGINDIEFPDEVANRGSIFVANHFGVGNIDWLIPGVWRINFNQTGSNIGGANGGAINLFDHTYNGVLFQGIALDYYTTPDAKILVGYSIEYIGDGNFRMISDGSALEPPPLQSILDRYDMVEWNMNNTISNTDLRIALQSNAVLFSKSTSGNFENYFVNVFSCPKEGSSNIAYVGTDFGNNTCRALVKQNGIWTEKLIPTNDQTNHTDHRYAFVVQSILNTSNPGSQDIVLWGNDGGLTKTSNHNFTTNQHTIQNLNGNGLYISDMIDIDNAYGKAITGSAWHDGWYVYDKITQNWGGEIFGDGTNAKVDKRFTSSNNYRMIYTHSIDGSWGFEYLNNPHISATYNPIILPEANSKWKYRPMQFIDDVLNPANDNSMNIGVRRAYYSNPNAPNGYATSTLPWQKYHGSPTLNSNYKAILDFEADLFSKAFVRSVKNPNIAYHLLFGRSKSWRLARGELNSLQQWDWFERTDALVSNTNPNLQTLTYTDLVVDDKDENRIFVSLGEIPWSYNYGDIRVFSSLNGGITYSDMSNGLPPLPVNCMVYQSGSDDIIYAGTDAGVYWWNKQTQCWIKMDNGMPNCLVSRLSIDYCKGTLLAATYGRGAWESPLVGMDPNLAQLN